MISREFPIHPDGRAALPLLPRSVPWSLVESHEAQAQSNHGQTLERLAERGGLDWMELRDVIEGRRWTGQTFNAKDCEYVLAMATAAAAVLRRLKKPQT